MARADDDTLRSWDDLRRAPAGRRRQVSVLTGSAAAVYLRERWAEHVDVVEYNGNTDAMMQVRGGVHDATLPDLPIAVFYRDQLQARGLRFVGEPVGRGAYVLFARLDDARLIDAIDAAIEKLFRDGRLQALYAKYGIWNATQEKLLSQDAAALAPARSLEGSGGKTGESPLPPHGLDVLRRYGAILLQSAGMTIFLSVASMPIAIVLGLFVALGRLYGPGPLRATLGAYVEALRGTPVMLQLYVIYFLLPELLPFRLEAHVAAIVGLAINYSAYEAEIYRAGLQAIPRGQMEAALSLGMTRAAALRRVVVPQAVRIVIPPVTNDFIALFKDTSVCSVIAVTELTKQYNVLANSTGAIVELAAMTGLMYLAMSYPLSLLARRMERRLAGETRAVVA
jgi:polar amino acid transport system substrate-binding protein